MRRFLVPTTLALLLCNPTLQAHTHLDKSIPADGSVLSTSPSTIVLNFSSAARLTGASIQRGDEPKQNLGPLPTGPAQEVTVALPRLPPGLYAFTWRVASHDGHVMSGTLHFTVSPARAAGESEQH